MIRSAPSCPGNLYVTPAFIVAGLVVSFGSALSQQSEDAPPATALERYDLHAPASEWGLPRRLTEISGLAFSGSRLFAHDDERAVIYELDYRNEQLIKAWALGDTPARGDFEGIAWSRDKVWLVTSNGRLYEGDEAEDDERVLYNTYGTGVGRYCEVEGLVYEPSDDTLLLLCKNARVAELADFVAIYRWSIAERRVLTSRIRIRLADLTPPGEEEGFRASGIDRDPETGNYILIAAPDERIAEVTPTGRVVRAEQWSGREHPQPEGIAIGPDGALYIADEGDGRRATLVRYAPEPGGR